MKNLNTLLLFTLLQSQAGIYAQVKETFTQINSSQIHYEKKGDGQPTVIFVSGLGESLETWKMVQDSISKYTTIISYDRAGLGKSSYHSEKKDLTSLTDELRTFINSTSKKSKLILVGHSLGCQIIKQYASRYPKKIKGIVFVDPGYNELNLRARLTDSVWQKREQLLKKYLPKFSAAQQAELNNLNTICSMADSISNLPKVPVTLLTATLINPGFPGSKTELETKKDTHALWLQTLPQAKHTEVKESRHYIQNDAPGVVIKSIMTMVAPVGRSTPL